MRTQARNHDPEPGEMDKRMAVEKCNSQSTPKGQSRGACLFLLCPGLFGSVTAGICKTIRSEVSKGSYVHLERDYFPVSRATIGANVSRHVSEMTK